MNDIEQEIRDAVEALRKCAKEGYSIYISLGSEGVYDVSVTRPIIRENNYLAEGGTTGTALLEGARD